MMASKSFVFRFDDVEVREREFTLIKAGKVLTVEPKAFRALLFLLHNPQKLISKEELLNSVWGDAAVTEGSLTRCIWLLRNRLGDDIRQPRYIATVATVGYRFVCRVEVSEDEPGNLDVAGKPDGFDGNDHVEERANKGIAGAADPQALLGSEAAGEAKSGRQKGESPERMRRWLLPGAAVLVVSLAATTWYAVRDYRAHWARDVAIPQIEKFVAADDYLPAFDLARQAEKRIPNDARLAALWPELSRVLSFETDPSGAGVFFKAYAAPDSEWRRLGTTPLNRITVPQGFFEWKFTKAGYEELHFAARTPAERLQLPFVPINPIQKIRMDPKGSSPAGMVRVPAGTLRLSIPAFGMIGPYFLEDYFIDRYEVTNREFKRFVDRGGYRTRGYWKEPFQKNGCTLTWEEAMNELRDSTGQPGPAIWEFGAYREGEEDFPVSGVSWYEAAAYAEFVNKKLPTVMHWYQAAAVGGAPALLPASNFSNKGPARVGQYQGITGSGAYDMAGNVKEWSSNESEDGLRFTMGGAWSDPSYLFFNPDARSAFDRSAANGFRCVRYTSPLSAALTGPVHQDFRNYSKEKPASDELFRTYKSFYLYEPSELKPSVDAITNSSPYWRVEKVSFQTAYGNQRMSAYLFLPKNVSPPYNPVVFFPGLTARFLPSSANIPLGKNNDSSLLDFVIRSGRAVLYPVYRGTYERALPIADTALGRREEAVFYEQDVRRSVDYLAMRPDVDLSHLVYYGFSIGGLNGPIMIALDPRFQTAVWLDGGLRFLPELPESDPINFLPRVKIPVLMVNGRSDFTFPLATLQNPMFRLLGTPEKDKRHIVYDAAHGVLFYHRNEVVRDILLWLDQYAPIKK